MDDPFIKALTIAAVLCFAVILTFFTLGTYLTYKYDLRHYPDVQIIVDGKEYMTKSFLVCERSCGNATRVTIQENTWFCPKIILDAISTNVSMKVVK